jgi:O-antigen ligase
MNLQRITGFLVLFCIAFAIVAATVLFGAVHVWSASGIYVLALILSLISALALALNSSEVRFGIADFCFIAFAGVVLFGYFRSPHEFLSRQELLSVISCVGFYLAVRIHLYRSWHFQTLCYVLFFVAVGISFYAIYQHFSESTRVLWRDQYLGYFGRASGTYICPNHFAGLIILAFPIALSLLIWSPLHPIARVILTYGLAVMSLGIFFSYSRGGLLSLGFAITMALFLGMRNKLKAAAVIIFVLVLIGASALLAVNLSNPEQWHRFLDGMKQGESTRPQMWRSAWQIFLDHPFFGVGPMMFDAWHAHYRGMLLNRAVYAHDDYLQLLADYGLLGGIVVSLLIISILAQLHRGSLKFKIFGKEYEVRSRRFLFKRAMFIGINT